eukprot:CAMPEP_0198244574 /NCGR_PEP_ID=MMETSP1446-20131203/36119_1 /TAXON_ID=1461542 ORGANISM="Unidentified sp, Strain CCMP2111" /NCGR_SAMPLE_ID=MMETSP1446 /ASSEMBLY_ACC=CAM_ASM_001112 /LENGTH=96 /DNA_ID=CAMNT_0043928643 /DNA_START=25 /DNA_END=315 /DNA_ORIENTATION=-
MGQTTISCTSRFASTWPTMSVQLTPVFSMMSLQMLSTSLGSSFITASGMGPPREWCSSISITLGGNGHSSPSSLPLFPEATPWLLPAAAQSMAFLT